MRRSEFQGTRAVFRFTLAQFLKGKSTIITMIVLVITVMISMLAASVSMNKSHSASEIKSVRIENSTDYAITAQDIAAANPIYAGISEITEGEAGATVSIAEQNGAYVVSATGGYSSGELSTLENAALSAFNTARAGGGSYTSSVMTLSEYRSPQTGGDQFTARFTVTYAYSILLMILVMYSTSYIVRAVIEEKASKLVELLMINPARS